MKKKYYNKIGYWDPQIDSPYEPGGGGGGYLPLPTAPPPVTTTPPPVTTTPPPLVNQFPVANAGQNQTIQLPTNSVILDGSASFDPEGGPLTYSWMMQTGPNSANISNIDQAITTASNLVAGTYTFLLSVADVEHASSAAVVSVHVLPANEPPPPVVEPPPPVVEPPPPVVGPPPPAVNAPPKAVAGENQTIQLPTNSVILDGSASFDPENGPLSFSWTMIEGPGAVTWSDQDKAKATASNLVKGHYAFQLSVMDSEGASSNATVYVDVQGQGIVNNTTASVTNIQRPLFIPTGGGSGGGGGAGSSTGVNKPIMKSKPNWWLWIFIVAATTYIIFGKNDSNGGS